MRRWSYSGAFRKNNGWVAWSKLFNRFDPKTPAKALMALMAVMTPKRVKDVRDLSNALENWEVKINALKADHDLEVGHQIKVAMMTSMLTPDLQDYVFQWSDVNTTFKELKDKVMSLAINRAPMIKPTPMEVDKVAASGWEDVQDEGEWKNEYEEVEIDYVGELCRRCGGICHYDRECPSQKGKGEGKGKEPSTFAKGKGKGYWDAGKG